MCGGAAPCIKHYTTLVLTLMTVSAAVTSGELWQLETKKTGTSRKNIALWQLKAFFVCEHHAADITANENSSQLQQKQRT